MSANSWLFITLLVYILQIEVIEVFLPADVTLKKNNKEKVANIMESTITSDVLNNNFKFWPCSKGTIDILLAMLLLIAIVFFIRKTWKDYKNHASVSTINADWAVLPVTIFCFSCIVFVNGARVHKTMQTASNISNTLTLNGNKLVVIPDFPNNQRYLVLDDYKTIAVIDANGYKSKSKKGTALYKLANIIYSERYTLKPEQDEQMYGKNNRINHVGKNYVIYSWQANGRQITYMSNVNTCKVNKKHDEVSGLNLVQANNDPNRLPFSRDRNIKK